MGDDDDRKNSKGSISSIWQRGKIRIGMGSAKVVKSVPSLTRDEGNSIEQGPTETDNLTQKQHRRAQVRKAQIEHRQRKENYVKQLEQDVIDLREMIATATTKSANLKQENDNIREAIAKAQVAKSSLPSTATLPVPPRTSQYYEPLDFSSFHQNYEISLDPQEEVQSYSRLWDISQSSSSLVSTCFDEFINASCLQISPILGQDIPMTNMSDDFISHGTTGLSSSTPDVDNFNTEGLIPNQPDLSTIAINFILALEHPCRTHFHAPASAFAPNGPPSGHELMASTFLYSSAPDTVFTSPPFKLPARSTAPNPTHHQAQIDDLSWTTPSFPTSSTSALSLHTLQAMASSLSKNDWELTPVQGWFILASRYPAHVLLSSTPNEQTTVLDRLKVGLGKIVNCFEFGAVMDEAKFWEVVERELGTSLGLGASALIT